MKSQRMTTGQIAELIAIDLDYACAGRGGIRVEVQELIAHLTSGGVAKQSRVENVIGEYLVPIPDVALPKEYKATLAKYRKLATEYGVPTTTAVCYRVKAGFTLKHHALKAGPCYENFQYLQDWNFSDEATEDGLVFWIPRIVKGSAFEAVDEQIQLLADLRTRLELPAHHMSGFGEVGLVAGLILAHFKATGERIPRNKYRVRTDTWTVDGGCLLLGEFGGPGLHCDLWGFGSSASFELGVLALGVEPLG